MDLYRILVFVKRCDDLWIDEELQWFIKSCDDAERAALMSEPLWLFSRLAMTFKEWWCFMQSCDDLWMYEDMDRFLKSCDDLRRAVMISVHLWLFVNSCDDWWRAVLIYTNLCFLYDYLWWFKKSWMPESQVMRPGPSPFMCIVGVWACGAAGLWSRICISNLGLNGYWVLNIQRLGLTPKQNHWNISNMHNKINKNNHDNKT